MGSNNSRNNDLKHDEDYDDEDCRILTTIYLGMKMRRRAKA